MLSGAYQTLLTNNLAVELAVVRAKGPKRQKTVLKIDGKVVKTHEFSVLQVWVRTCDNLPVPLNALCRARKIRTLCHSRLPNEQKSPKLHGGSLSPSRVCKKRSYRFSNTIFPSQQGCRISSNNVDYCAAKWRCRFPSRYEAVAVECN